jgi:uncharacterized protein
MCGGFVCALSGIGNRESRIGAFGVAYNLGRLISYLTLGIVAGAIGRGADRLGAFVGLGRVAAIVAGVLMVAWGIAKIVEQRGVRVERVSSFGQRLTSRLVGVARRQSPTSRALTLGLITTLIPCGWLYAFVLTAAGTGSAARGALVMLTFWLGTLPMMLALGAGVQRAFGPLRRRLPLVSATLMIAIGLLSIGGKMHAPAMNHVPEHQHAAR